jgi:hypothetical protein
MYTSLAQTNIPTKQPKTDPRPFILLIPKPFIDLYQLGDANTHPILEEVKKLLNDPNAYHEITTKDIDKAAYFVIVTFQN